MVQIIRRPTFGGMLGEAVGTGLSGGLQTLAQQKLNQLQAAQMMQAGQRAQLDQTGVGSADPLIEALAALELPGEAIPEEIQDMELPEIKALIDEFISLPEKEKRSILDEAGIPEKIPTPPKPIPLKETIARLEHEKEAKIPPRRRALKKALADPRLTQAQRFKIAAMEQKKGQEEKKLSLTEQKEADAVTKEFSTDVNLLGTAAISNNSRINKMQQLLDTGRLSSPTIASLIEVAKARGYGLDLSGLMSPESQEFKKLSLDFLRNIKEIFGGRILSVEIENFLKTVPTLIMSDAGKQRIINNMRIFNETAIVKKKVMNSIVKANKGRRPADLELRVGEIMDPMLGKIAEKFRSTEPIHESELGPNFLFFRSKKGGKWYGRKTPKTYA